MLILMLFIFMLHRFTSLILKTSRLTLHRFTLHHSHAASPENQPDTLPFRFIRRSTAGSMSIPLFGEPLQTELPQRTLLLIARFGISVMLILTPLIFMPFYFTPLIFMLFHRKLFISTQLIFTLHRLTLHHRKLFILTTFCPTLHRLMLHHRKPFILMLFILTLHRLMLFLRKLFTLTPFRFEQNLR